MLGRKNPTIYRSYASCISTYQNLIYDCIEYIAPFSSVFFQIQQVLGHLQESKLQYHEPERFWKVFKLWGQTVNIREQQDAFDFFQALIDQIDEHLKVREITLGKLSIYQMYQRCTVVVCTLCSS